MRSSNGIPVCVLEINTHNDHFFRCLYTDREKAHMAAKGFHMAMKADPMQIAAIWSNEHVVTLEGVAGDKVPMFSVRCGEIASVALREAADFLRSRMDDDDYEEEWKS